MKKICLSFLLLIIVLSNSLATIITVDNNVPSIGNYTTLQAAHDAASPGDTIYVFPSDYFYNAITISKKLILMGCGFESQNGLKTSRLKGVMTFVAGSDGSSLEGFDCYFRELSITIEASNIKIKRNELARMNIAQGHTGNLIEQNRFDDDFRGWTINVSAPNQLEINNNFICNYYSYDCCSGCIAFANDSTVVGTIANNIINCGNRPGQYNQWNLWTAINTGNSNSIVKNNIIYSGNCVGNFNMYFNNMSSLNSGFPTSNENLGNIDMTTVFINWDQQNYHLKPGSPAIGTGMNGTDMGIYGGDYPYIDGGFPGIPSVYYLSVPTTGSQQNGINVTIKAKSNPN